MTQETEAAKTSDKRRTRDSPPTKVVIRRLPPSLTGDSLLEQISPLPKYDFFYFMKADLSLGQNAFSRAYINFLNYEDIASFRDKFDDYVFVDGKGNEFPAIVEFSTFQKVPKKKAKKPDSKKGTIEQDGDYLKFLESLENPDDGEELMNIDTYLEQLEAKEREAKATKGGPKVTTPLIEFIKKRKEEKRNSILRAREERKKKEAERKQAKEDERRKRKEREAERDKDRKREKDGEKEKNDGKEKDTPVKNMYWYMPTGNLSSDRPRSARDDANDDRRSDRRPKSYREEREQRRQNRDDNYRDDRPRGGPPARRDDRRDDRRFKDDSRDRDRDRARNSNNNSSSGYNKDSQKPSGATVTKSDKPAGTTKYEKKDTSSRKPDDRKEDKGGKSGKTVEGERTGDEERSKTDTEGKKERERTKDRPERAIYDPRKAAERRLGAKKDGGKDSPTESPRDEKEGTPV